jgi:hypothetical protein
MLSSSLLDDHHRHFFDISTVESSSSILPLSHPSPTFLAFTPYWPCQAFSSLTTLSQFNLR